VSSGVDPGSRALVRTLGNVLWLVLAGWWLALGYLIAGVLACILIVTIPFGLQAFKLALFTVWPFGRVVVERPDADPWLGLVGNVVWLIVFGVELALAHLVAGVLLCLTIVGIPLGLAAFKLIPLALLPFGKEIVPAEAVPPGSRFFGPPPVLGSAGRA
jgi:uncharacterized membrane protein YccF (DUF307 family)